MRKGGQKVLATIVDLPKILLTNNPKTEYNHHVSHNLLNRSDARMTHFNT